MVLNNLRIPYLIFLPNTIKYFYDKYDFRLDETSLKDVIDIHHFLSYIQNHYVLGNLYSRFYQLLRGLYLYCMLRLFKYGTCERLHSNPFAFFIAARLYWPLFRCTNKGLLLFYCVMHYTVKTISTFESNWIPTTSLKYGLLCSLKIE